MAQRRRNARRPRRLPRARSGEAAHRRSPPVPRHRSEADRREAPSPAAEPGADLPALLPLVLERRPARQGATPGVPRVREEAVRAARVEPAPDAEPLSSTPASWSTSSRAWRAHMAASDEAARDDAAVVRQILAGLGKKLDELTQATEATREADKLSRALLEYERIRKYMNVIVGHAVNPWLRRQTVELPTEFEFRKEDVTRAVRAHVSQQGIEWERDVQSFEAHGIRGTLGCRALLRFVDGSSKGRPPQLRPAPPVVAHPLPGSAHHRRRAPRAAPAQSQAARGV